MPQILSINDPALVATLASQASGYRSWHDQQELGLQHQSLDQQGQYQQGRLQVQQQALANQLANGGTNQLPQTPGGTEMLPNGAQIYHPQGDGYVPQQQQGGGGGRSIGGAATVPGLYLSPLQQQQHALIDQMEGAGHLQPAEAMRWRALVTAGQDPFGNPTSSEQLAQIAAKRPPAKPGAMSDQASIAADDRLSRENESLDNASYTRQRESLKDQLDSVNKRLTAAVSSSDRKSLNQQATDLEKKLADLPNSYTKPTARTRAAAAGPAAGAAPPPAAGGSASMNGSAPITQSDVTYLVGKYGSAAKARAAAFAGERAPAAAGVSDPQSQVAQKGL